MLWNINIREYIDVIPPENVLEEFKETQIR